jgi:transcriptional regulator with GAF, ATPase, and Fis domain
VADGTNLRLADALGQTARELVERLEADACVISRALGDVLIIVAQHTTDGRTLNFGQGFLVSDYPETRAVLTTGEPRALTLADDRCDEAEAALLREMGYAALLMFPLELGGDRWGLVELYRAEPRPFDVADASL